MAATLAKVADLAGPGLGNYTELEKILPNDYHSLLDRLQMQKPIHAVKNYIEENQTIVNGIVPLSSGVA